MFSLVGMVKVIKSLMTFDVTFKSPIEQPGWGSEVGYTTLGTVKADVRQLSGEETYRIGRVDNKEMYRVYIEIPDFTITRGDIAEVDGTNYNIERVYQPSATDFLQIDVFREE